MHVPQVMLLALIQHFDGAGPETKLATVSSRRPRPKSPFSAQ
jgi:hypothetical protein